VKKVLRSSQKKMKSSHKMHQTGQSVPRFQEDSSNNVCSVTEDKHQEQPQTNLRLLHSRRKQISAARKTDSSSSIGTTLRVKTTWAREKAAESYRSMIDAEQLGFVCLVEKCYVIVGVQEQEQTILLSALQKLVDYERYVDSKDPDDRLSKTGKRGKISEAKFNQILFRHRTLSFIQNELFLSEKESKLTFPQSQMEMVYSKRHFFEKVLPIPDAPMIRLPLPLPQIGKEWGLAQLLLTIGPNSLVLALMLLLLERPVLLLGESVQMVTSCARALMELLKPYEWASTFMPILPYSMLDFVLSPVPFIGGVVVDGPHRVSLVVGDHRTMEAMAEGMSLINLTTGSLIITSEQGIARMLNVPIYLRETLTSLYFRLKVYQANASSALRSFEKFMNNGFSPRERVTLYSARITIESHFRNLSADLASDILGWKRYGKNDTESDFFDFYPAWFMKARHEELRFQEALVHTQLFVGYVDSRRNEYLEREKLSHSEAGERIAKWMLKKWKENRHR